MDQVRVGISKIKIVIWYMLRIKAVCKRTGPIFEMDYKKVKAQKEIDYSKVNKQIEMPCKCAWPRK